MNERKMQSILMRELMHVWNVKMLVPNSTMLCSWEADVLAVVNSLMTHEFEIKVSRSDFLADKKKKNKHGAFLHNYLRTGAGRRWDGAGEYIDKYHGYIHSWGLVPSYFWYVTHGFAISVDDIPEYAGLIVISGASRSGYDIDVRKKAPRLNTIKITDRDMKAIARILSFRLADSYQLEVG